MSSYKNLFAFIKAFSLAMKIFEFSKRFPKEETYSLTDQIRRTQDQFAQTLPKRSENENIQLIFLSKLSDSDAENADRCMARFFFLLQVHN